MSDLRLPEHLVKRIRAGRVAQGLPPTLEDPTTYVRLARLMACTSSTAARRREEVAA